MTTIVSSRNSRTAVPAARPATAAARGLAWIRHRLRIRRDTAMLLALSDHLLTDMGVRRDQVRHAVREGCLQPGADRRDP
ncbi:hypothetical protein ACFW16_13955 [Inquilinus sp. NPDC058860]|uniref:hypothetical protein n=1 Tax=Inquilinus sp. NPDC058860 TaxID=3346652 RepID=UPI0036CA3AF0